MATQETMTITEGDYTAVRLPYTTEWQEGAIDGGSFTSLEAEADFVRQALRVTYEVPEAQLPYGSCGDGRFRVRLEGMKGGHYPVPVRLQAMGSTAVTGFRIAEAVRHVYPERLLETPPEQRLRYAVDLMHANGVIASTHQACGGAEGFATVVANEAAFHNKPGFAERVEATMPAGSYDLDVHAGIVHQADNAAQRDIYAGFGGEHVIRAVRHGAGSQARKGAEYAVEVYRDDGRGVYGHVEAVGLHYDETIPAAALSPNGLHLASGGGQAFSVNGALHDRLAEVFASEVRPGQRHGLSQEQARLIGLTAAASFEHAAQGTLAHGLPSWLVSRVA